MSIQTSPLISDLRKLAARYPQLQKEYNDSEDFRGEVRCSPEDMHAHSLLRPYPVPDVFWELHPSTRLTPSLQEYQNLRRHGEGS